MIVVDDGAATGGTVIATLQGVRKNRPRPLLLAVPVAPPDAVAALRAPCDELVCLETTDPFYAVGAHHAGFTRTEDGEVVELCVRVAAARGNVVDHTA